MSWDDWSSNPPPVADTDKWHVQLAPDEVKVVSLEQLDDLFRLSIVDSETQVWQTGMTQWQPLRVIAGLDEPPAPLPKRAPPKPPTPPTRTVVMAVQPARPAPQAMPSVRPPPPAPLSLAPAPAAPAPSVRPPMPAARTVSLAPATFYPEPIQARSSTYPPQVAYAAPIALAAPVQAMNSVRPLVVSQPPPIVARGGGGFGRFLVGVALLAGVSVTAYRNDFVRDAAHEAHQDALYARLESALGGPAFGTLRALEPSAAAQPMSELSASDAAPIRTALGATPSAPSTPAAAIGTGTPPVVSLESLAPEQRGAALKNQPAATPPPSTPAAAPTQVPVRAAASFAAKPAAAPASVKPAPAKASAPAKPAVEKPAPAPKKPLADMSERERLNAAIGQSMMQADAPKSKSKAKAKGNEYDPLNPTL